jgi:UDP-glucuronate 4-epimerase
MKKILITGTAGFIGFHLVERLLKDVDFDIVGLDVINDYYDINLKYNRLDYHGINAVKLKNGEEVVSSFHSNYRFVRVDLADLNFIVAFMIKENFDFVVNLAAQAGVRYSIDNPTLYVHSNINGFLSILEGCRQSKVKHLLYASTSSVYGLNKEMPLSERQNTDHPISFYSASKKSNELMAHCYSHLYNVPTTGLRFFTVYGPWGRPDMALFKFTSSILENKPIQVYNHGKMIRDFTYVSDVIESIVRLIEIPAESSHDWDPEHPVGCNSSAPYRILNIGNNSPVQLNSYIEVLEVCLEKKAVKEYLEMQAGDVEITHADTRELENLIGYLPNTSVLEGVERFVKWYKNYYDV